MSEYFTQDFVTSRRNYNDGDSRVGQLGRLWYDSSTNTIRIGDGTAGGRTISSGDQQSLSVYHPNGSLTTVSRLNFTGDGVSVTDNGNGVVTVTLESTASPSSPGSVLNATDSITKNLTLTTDWQDTGINGTDITTGTYILQLFANDTGAGGTNSNEYYSGIMSWYAGSTNGTLELPTDEIPLHRAGGGGSSELYLRTYRSPTASTDNLKLQIYSNIDNASPANYVFKFLRII